MQSREGPALVQNLTVWCSGQQRRMHPSQPYSLDGWWGLWRPRRWMWSLRARPGSGAAACRSRSAGTWSSQAASACASTCARCGSLTSLSSATLVDFRSVLCVHADVCSVASNPRHFDQCESPPLRSGRFKEQCRMAIKRRCAHIRLSFRE